MEDDRSDSDGCPPSAAYVFTKRRLHLHYFLTCNIFILFFLFFLLDLWYLLHICQPSPSLNTLTNKPTTDPSFWPTVTVLSSEQRPGLSKIWFWWGRHYTKKDEEVTAFCTFMVGSTETRRIVRTDSRPRTATSTLTQFLNYTKTWNRLQKNL